jgi:transcriptional regulator with XRE-family HTH domain
MDAVIKKSLTQISQETGLSLSHISRIFSGDRNPSWDNAKLIADCLDISVDRLSTILQEVDHATKD